MWSSGGKNEERDIIQELEEKFKSHSLRNINCFLDDHCEDINSLLDEVISYMEKNNKSSVFCKMSDIKHYIKLIEKEYVEFDMANKKIFKYVKSRVESHGYFCNRSVFKFKKDMVFYICKKKGVYLEFLAIDFVLKVLMLLASVGVIYISFYCLFNIL